MLLKSPCDLFFSFDRLVHYLRGSLGINSSVRMAYQKHKQHRLPGYDYAQSGAYFVTICTRDREHFFGKVTEGKMQLSEIGKITADCRPEEFLLKTSDTFKNSTLDCWVIMPNHVHLILVIHPGNSGYSGYSGNAPGRPRRGAFPLYPLVLQISELLLPPVSGP